ncbi:MAG: hypothetical protein CFE21_10605 [Bacteroidetes bacterium B1(2017)]|nr:MAG: hypothetical protein CFE21_10605 [Bacteroidetes bacterium B1(2017)]
MLSIPAYVGAQNNRELKLNLNESGSHYLKATFTTQLWARANESNPGTKVFGYTQDQTFDIGLRRVRAQFFGMVNDKVFVYSQVGINNFNAMSARKPGIFFHDVMAEYQFTPKVFQAGMGLTAWTGFSRFSSPAVASILGYDAPLYQQTTNDVNDQFLRKLSMYGKGKLGKLDYRVVVSTPMAIQNVATSVVKPINTNSDFSYKPAKIQTSAYFMYQFLDQESNLTPYMAGTYLGKKKVFNIGAGYQLQPKAMWHYSDTSSAKKSIEEDMLNYNVDVFYDAPVGTKGAAISAYVAFTHLGFGKNYLRNSAVMNPADAASTSSLGGGGNGIPLYGTGNVLYAQLGYLLPFNSDQANKPRIQPYVMVLHGNYDRLKSACDVYDIGLNYFISGHSSKLTLNLQNRPVYDLTGHNSGRRNALILQFQVAI